MRYQFLLLFFLAIALTLFVSGCSPVYVVRAGWEEAGILMRRKPITHIVQEDGAPEGLKEKLQLVLEARAFAEELGLAAKGSYQQFSEVDRDVLVWVLSAAKKNSLEPATWWFPIVGRIPYKGFFEKEDAIEEAEELASDGYDTYIRPSLAYSTLGWFDDPLLSTLIRFDSTMLVDTVIHEILHNTVWVPGNAEFNESLANFVGAHGAQEFFRRRGDLDRAEMMRKRWMDEQSLAKFLVQLMGKLNQLYEGREPDEAFLGERDKIFTAAREEWERGDVQIPENRGVVRALNNASIIALRTYLTQPEVFDSAFALCEKDLKRFIQLLKSIEGKLRKDNPYEVLKREVQSSGCSNRESHV